MGFLIVVVPVRWMSCRHIGFFISLTYVATYLALRDLGLILNFLLFYSSVYKNIRKAVEFVWMR